METPQIFFIVAEWASENAVYRYRVSSEKIIEFGRLSRKELTVSGTWLTALRVFAFVVLPADFLGIETNRNSETAKLTKEKPPFPH